MEPTLTGLAERIDIIVAGTDTFFLLLGAILVLFMHAGFAFLEVGTVRHKNQVNANKTISSVSFWMQKKK